MNSVERVKNICRERRIPISRLEKDLGFANGYVGQLKKGTFPDERLDKIADYLNVSTDFLLGKEKAPTEDDGRRRSSKDELLELVRETTDEKTLLEIMSLAAEKLRGMKD